MRTLFVISLALLIAAPLYAQSDSDIRIVSENSTSIVLEYVPRYQNRVISGADGKNYTRFAIHGEAIDDGDAGSPLTPYRPVLLNMPSRRYSVQVIAQDYDDLAAANAATQPTWRPNKGFGISPVYSSPNPKFARSELVPQQIAQLVNVGESRGLLLGTLKLYPVQVSLGRNQARIYRRLVVRIDFATTGSSPAPVSAFLKHQFPSILNKEAGTKAQGLAGDSPLAQGDVYRMEVTETGIYRIDQSFLSKSGISASAIGNINSIRIFGNGGREVPEDLNVPRPNGLQEISRLVVDNNGNGVFDADDFVLFFGRSTRGWNYSPSEGSFHHYINHYTETSVYFLTFGGVGRGKDMAPLPSTAVSSAYKPTDFQGKIFVEDELDNLLNSGREWVGRKFDPQGIPVNTFTNSLPAFVSTKPMQYRFVFLTSSATDDLFRIQESGAALGNPIPMASTFLGVIVGPIAYRSDVVTFNRVGALPNDQSVLRIEYAANNSAAQGWLDWFEILFRQRFEAANDLLLFTSPDTTALVEYSVSNFSSRDVFVFDVTQDSSAKQITNLAFDAANTSLVRFQASQSSGTVREFAAVGPKGYKSPANVKRVANSNLHGTTEGADFVIISPPEFLANAQRLGAWREQRDQLKTSVVNLDQVFNEFSSGMPDPMGIRDFLKYTQTAWTRKPHYVLLFGAASYDYKNIKTFTPRNWVPPYETLESIDQVGTLASDDFFVFLDPTAQRISMAIGRLPVYSTDDARIVVDKIIAYETTAPLDPWRTRITFVADDGLTTTTDDGSTHTAQSETLAQDYTPDTFTKQKIFEVEYPTVNTSTGRTKPTVNQAIDQAINQGTLILNWTGHGNTQQWAHEKVFAVDLDFPLLNNKGRPFFLVAATCDFARYDNPEDKSGGELLLLMDGQGSIAEVAADRVGFSDDNASLNWKFYDNLLSQTDSSGKPIRLGDALWLTKQDLNSSNDQKHHLLGDPTMRLAIPRGRISVDSLNGQSASTPVTVGALAKVKVSASLKSPDGSALNSVQGRAIIEAYDSKRKIPVPDWGDFTFVVNGSLIYRGEVSVRNGSLQGIFPIPKDVSYGSDRSRINVYSWNDSTDGMGYTENISIAGTASAVVDTAGPGMQIYFNDQAFRPGDIVGPDATLIVDLTDSSGINTSTAGIGHKLEATLDGSQRSIDLTNYYRGNLDTYQSGEVRYQFSELPEGRHALAVKAWDIYNNPSTSETYFEVRSSSALAIYNVFNFPNPFARNTTFTFQRSSTDPIDVEVKIYTVAGRLIRILESPSVVDRFVQIPWDGRDRDGNELANGVYLYRVIAKSLDKTSTSEALGKLAVLR